MCMYVCSLSIVVNMSLESQSVRHEHEHDCKVFGDDYGSGNIRAATSKCIGNRTVVGAAIREDDEFCFKQSW